LRLAGSGTLVAFYLYEVLLFQSGFNLHPQDSRNLTDCMQEAGLLLEWRAETTKRLTQ